GLAALSFDCRPARVRDPSSCYFCSRYEWSRPCLAQLPVTRTFPGLAFHAGERYTSLTESEFILERMASNRAGCLLLVNDTFVLQYEVNKPLTCRSRFGDGGADAAMTPRYKISNPK